MEVKKIFIHGNLSTYRDWQTLVQEPNSIYVDLWQDFQDLKNPNFKTWAQIFWQKYAISSTQKYEIYAYSMGARLALHAFLQKPELFAKVVFFSAHCGLKSTAEKIVRQEQDSHWIKLLVTKPWGDFLDLWNQQAVFQNEQSTFNVNENLFDKKTLAYAWSHFSLSQQENLSPDILHCLNTFQGDFYWVVGQKDSKFVEHAKNLSAHPKVKLHILENRGHRIPWPSTAWMEY